MNLILFVVENLKTVFRKIFFHGVFYLDLVQLEKILCCELQSIHLLFSNGYIL